jgi:hypothetical protein
VPEIHTGTRADNTYGGYHYLPVGTSPYYYEVQTEGEGTVVFWVYDPGKCLQNLDPGYGDNGPQWGVINPLYQIMAMGISRQWFLAGCQGYKPWSSVSPYTPTPFWYWLKDGLRGANNVPWSPGWYKWRINGQMDNITFTLYNVTYCITDGPPDDDTTTGDCAQTYDATSYGGTWAVLFGYGWKGFWLRGDMATGIEDISVDVVGTSGAFMEGMPCERMHFSSIPDTNAYVNILYTCRINPIIGTQIKAAAKQTQDINCSLLTCPRGMTVDSTGLLTFLPTELDTGKHEVVIKASSSLFSHCGTQLATLRYFLNVLPGQHIAGSHPALINAFDFIIQPNPTVKPVTLEFSSPAARNIELAVFDFKGRCVRDLSRKIPAGECRILWDGKNEQGRQLPAGIYLVKATAGGRCVIKKMMYSTCD